MMAQVGLPALVAALYVVLLQMQLDTPIRLPNSSLYGALVFVVYMAMLAMGDRRAYFIFCTAVLVSPAMRLATVATTPIEELAAVVLMAADRVLILALIAGLVGGLVGCQPIPPLQSRLLLLWLVGVHSFCFLVAYTKTELAVVITRLAPAFNVPACASYVLVRSTRHAFVCSSRASPVETLCGRPVNSTGSLCRGARQKNGRHLTRRGLAVHTQGGQGRRRTGPDCHRHAWGCRGQGCQGGGGAGDA